MPKTPQESRGNKQGHVSAFSDFLIFCYTCLALTIALSHTDYSGHTIQLANHNSRRLSSTS